MNKFKLYIFLGLLCFIFPLGVKAATLEASCDSKKIISGDNLNCTLILKGAGTKFSKVDMKINNSTYLTAMNIIDDNEWISNFNVSSHELSFNSKDDVEYNTTKTLGTVVFKVSEGSDDSVRQMIAEGSNEVIKFMNIVITDVSNQSNNLVDVTKNLRISSTINTLRSLNVTIGETPLSFDNVFDSNTFLYNATTEAATINIVATASNSSATITGTGNKTLKYGENELFVTVTSEYGVKKDYKLVIDRSDNRSTDSSLSKLTITGQDIEFSPTTYDYDLQVENEVTTLNIEAIATDTKATVTYTKTNTLIEGINRLEIKVVAENTDKVTTYMLNVTRKAEDLSSDCDLKDITIDNYNISFSKDTLLYELKIKDEDKLDIEVERNDPKAVFEISGNDKLDDGSIINITVIAQDGTKKNYAISISKNIRKETSKILTTVIFDDENKNINIGEKLIIIGTCLFVISLTMLIIFSIIDRKNKQTPRKVPVVKKDKVKEVITKPVEKTSPQTKERVTIDLSFDDEDDVDIEKKIMTADERIMNDFTSPLQDIIKNNKLGL